jgi:hypothetical protein
MNKSGSTGGILLALITLALGIGLGLFLAYVVFPVEFINATPDFLRPDLQTDYLRMVIDSYKLNGDADLALERYQALGADAPTRLAEIISSPGTQDPGTIVAFSQLVQTVSATPPTPTASSKSDGSSWSLIIIVVGLVLVFAVIGAAAFYLFRTRGGGQKTAAQQASELSRQVEKTDYEAMGEEPPIAQFVTTYVIGDDLFDDSFSIDSPSGEFLGECGVGICDTIGVGDPKKVTAFEVWLFDKNDIQTVTKVVMSLHAFNDPTLRNKLASKGELILAEVQKQVVLETATLQMVVSVADVQYGEGALPQTSYFDRMTLELAIWPKQASQPQR